MIVRSLPAGRSFRWLAHYLLHDPKAETAERVAWTHTLNLAHDDVASAVHEMYQTYLDRDLLKREAGVRPGGSSLEKPVKHISLSWDISEKPSREEMIAVAESYLQRMGWREHQCLLVAHDDKPHPHIHLMMNMVHPERGTRLNDSYERRRAQAWALAHEKSSGNVLCKERLKPVEQRQKSSPRNVWEQLQTIRERIIEALPAPSPELVIDYSAPVRQWRKQEWAVLKERQQAERKAFFENGRVMYRELRQSVYQEVRAVYRKEWAAHYAAMRAGLATTELARIRKDLTTRQNATLRERALAASQEIRARRDDIYEELLDRQRADRAELAGRQEKGLTSSDLLRPTLAVSSAPERPIDLPVPPAPDVRTDQPFQWTHRAGLVPQQRSARRWLDQAMKRLSKLSPSQQTPSRSPLAEAQERIAREKRHRTNPVKESAERTGIEPER